ncbi:MupG family TIM beta-alpha barrel fold protein [Erysipelothrix urinaevulpis]|uniref:MupG family TIM beta-alpha barrel fold protein n=1 Tax=Erysipelothrix urinaevulpis TaxID=2683717 RepID=UPI00135A6D4A|nr:MupG family TIM beta-alpha barrel fold protein [Erysipelothrix urinaevulpis]
MLGISSYFKDLDYKYLEDAAKIGAKYIFTSLHIPEEDLSKLDEMLPKFQQACLDLGLQLVPDISPATFEKLGVEENDYQALKEKGFKVLRLDYGFDDYDVIKALLQDFDLVLNASVVDEEYIVDAKANGVDFTNISVMHNFYPKTETGLSLDYFNKRNASFIKHGIHIMAFVPGDRLKRFPLYEGLPTVEKHRQVNPYVAAVELIHACGIHDVLIGDSLAHNKTLEYIQAYMEDNTLHIPVHFNKDYVKMYEEVYNVRRDLSENVIRMATPRIPEIAITDNNARPKGSITIENALSGRYSGEIQITKKDFPMDARTNVIGFIHPDFVSLVDYIDRNTKIQFVRID